MRGGSLYVLSEIKCMRMKERKHVGQPKSFVIPQNNKLPNQEHDWLHSTFYTFLIEKAKRFICREEFAIPNFLLTL